MDLSAALSRQPASGSTALLAQATVELFGSLLLWKMVLHIRKQADTTLPSQTSSVNLLSTWEALLRSCSARNRVGLAPGAQPMQKRHHRTPVCKRRLNQVKRNEAG